MYTSRLNGSKFEFQGWLLRTLSLALFLGVATLFFAPSGVSEPQEEPNLAASEPKIEMLGLEIAEPEWPKAQSGEKWFALLETKKGRFELVSVTITVKDELDTCTNEIRPNIYIDHPGYPLFLVRGSDRFLAGPLESGSCMSRLLPGRTSAVNCCDTFKVKLCATGTVGRDPQYGTPIINDYKISLRALNREVGNTQTLLRVSETWDAEEFPTINWVGDLDRDGRPDFLIDEQPYPGGLLILYLSSLAEEGEIVHRTAELVHASC